MKRYVNPMVGMLLVLFLAAACAPSTVTLDATRGAANDVAGFWKGLWHGFIVVFTFIASLFNDNVGIYESHNSGNLYNLGFLLGTMIFFGSSGGGACKKRKC